MPHPLYTPTQCRFVFDEGDNYSKWFTVSPVTNLLHAGEKSQAVSITFKPDQELVLKDKPILICHVRGRSKFIDQRSFYIGD